ncbi:hypothetical protein, partial [Helicobacter marmotae]|uniref:hypothetical protein n=1 Tax=Helicobacter marmotae TaxID=152490 RepID=UPI001F2C8B93
IPHKRDALRGGTSCDLILSCDENISHCWETFGIHCHSERSEESLLATSDSGRDSSVRLRPPSE